MPAVTPLIGAVSNQVWKPPFGVTPGAAGDVTAPFTLGSTVTGVAPRNLMQFARAAGTIAIAGTVGITSAGVTTTAATGNTWTNDTGVQLVLGDYAWFSAAAVTSP